MDPEPLPVVLHECRPGSCWPWRRTLSLPAGASVLPYKHMLTRTHMCIHMHTCSRFSRTHRSASTRVNTGLCTTPHSVYALTSAHVDPHAAQTLICVHTPTLVHAAYLLTNTQECEHTRSHICVPHLQCTCTQMPAHTCTQHMYSQIDRSASIHMDTCMCTTLHSVHAHRPTCNTHAHTERHTCGACTHTHTHTQVSGCLPFPGQCLLSPTGHFPGF